MDRVLSFAKINLILKIVGRAAGFHQIQSLFQTVSLADLLEFEAADSFSFEAEPKNLQDQNLVVKAYALLQSQASFPAQKIKLIKKIPVAAGLGGGSSNAATTLNYLNQKYQLGFSTIALKKMGAELGSDVPFFIEGGTQWVEGRGEHCFPLTPMPACWILLVNPLKDCPTSLVFAEFKKQNISFSPAFPKMDWQSVLNQYFAQLPPSPNDLLAPAMHLVPEIGDILHAIQKYSPLFSNMSGSGASCFGIFEHQESAIKCMEALPQHWFKTLVMPVNQAFEVSPDICLQ